MKELGIDPGEEKISEIVEKRLREEISAVCRPSSIRS